MVADPVNIFRILPPFSAKSERQVFVTAQKLIKREDFDFGVLNMKSALFFKRNDLQRFNISKCMCKLYQTAGYSLLRFRIFEIIADLDGCFNIRDIEVNIDSGFC